MPGEAGKALVRRAVEAFNAGDIAAVDVLFAPDFRDYDPSRVGLPAGPEGIKAVWGMMRAAFPDLTVVIEDMLAEGDKVVVRAQIRGTHRGELMGIPPTGNAVSFSVIDITRISGGQLAERWAVADMLSLLQQLGVMPSMG